MSTYLTLNKIADFCGGFLRLEAVKNLETRRLQDQRTTRELPASKATQPRNHATTRARACRGLQQIPHHSPHDNSTTLRTACAKSNLQSAMCNVHHCRHKATCISSINYAIILHLQEAQSLAKGSRRFR